MKYPKHPAPPHGPERSQDQEQSRPVARKTSAGTGKCAVSPGVARQIDENLKRLYAQNVEQDLPPALRDLVARLREGQAAPGADDEGHR